jgi:pimeloyl-ACP methyl ester carboxylesterase
MGGWIAAAYALMHPEKVERLALVDAAGFAPPANFDMRQLSKLNPSTREGMKELASLVFYNKQLFSSDAAIDLMLTQRITAGDGYTIQSLIESIARREDMLDGRLSAIKQPTLIVWGREDGLTPLAEYGERFKREIAGSRLLVFDGCGHVPQVEKASAFNAALLEFLSASAPASN